ncbi:MAG: SRPBCC domain-containing protein [Deltaproteobacteria bacterium]|nr:SRPBCC domain-containing protein [Deltaproteobacteria bacterium]
MKSAAVVVVVAAFLSSCSTVMQMRPAETIPVNAKAERTRNDQGLDYSVATSIAAPPETVWKLLVDAPGYKSWNTTIVKLEGTIALDSKIELVSKDAPDQTFHLTVSTFEPSKRMVWQDGGSMFLGVRNFTLIPIDGGGTTFVMSETFSGGLLGMIEGSLPDFAPSFDTFAADLKKAAEAAAPAAPAPTEGANPAP